MKEGSKIKFVLGVVFLGILFYFVSQQGPASILVLALIALSLFMSVRGHQILFLVLAFLPPIVLLHVGRFSLRPMDIYIPFFWLIMLVELPRTNFLEIFRKSPWKWAFIWLFVAIMVACFKTEAIFGSAALSRSLVFAARFLMYASTYFVFASFLKDEKDLRLILIALRGLFWIYILSGLIDWYFHTFRGMDNVFLPYVEEAELERAGPVGPVQTQAYRLNGLLGTPENFGMQLAFLIPFEYLWYHLYRTQRGLSAAAILLSFILIQLSGTRTAFLLAGVEIAAFFVLLGERFKTFIYGIGLGAVFLVAMFTQSGLWMRFEKIIAGKETSLFLRLEVFRSAWKLIQNDWLLGKGWGTFQYSMERFFPYLASDLKLTILRTGYRTESSAMEMFLNTWHDTGLMGLIPFLAIWGITFYVSFKVSFSPLKDPWFALSRIVFVSVIILFISNFLGTSPIFLVLGGVYQSLVLFTFYCACLYCLQDKRRDSAATL